MAHSKQVFNTDSRNDSKISGSLTTTKQQTPGVETIPIRTTSIMTTQSIRAT